MLKYFFLIVIISSSSVIYGQKGYRKIKSNDIFKNNNQVFTKDNIPLNGYYCIKYTKRKCSLSYFENGFRQGISKELFHKTIEKKGTYLNGLKHGVWEDYSLGITSEYKNGKKNGKEFGKTFDLGRFICNYSNDSIDGLLLRYNYKDSLDSKEYYRAGQIMSIDKYDDLLNIIETSIFTYDNNIIIESKRTDDKDIIKIDSIFYENYAISPWSNNIGTPFKIIKFENKQKILELEILSLRDTSCKSEMDRKLSITYCDKKSEKTEMYFYYNYHLYSYNISLAKQSIIMRNSKDILDPEDLYLILNFNGFTEINIYVNCPNSDTLYTIKHYKSDNYNMFDSYSLIEVNKLAPVLNTY